MEVPSKYSEEKSIKPDGDGVDIKINVKDEIRGSDLQNKDWIHLESAGKVPTDALPHSGVTSAEAYVKVKICPEEVASNFTPRCDKIFDKFLLAEGKVLAKLLKLPQKRNLMKQPERMIHQSRWSWPRRMKK